MEDFAINATKVNISSKGCLKSGPRTVRRTMVYDNEM
jgi:hypothetical protein